MLRLARYCSWNPAFIRHTAIQSQTVYLKLKQLVTLLLRFEVLDGIQQDVDSFCVGDALEARFRNMLQPVLDFRI